MFEIKNKKIIITGSTGFIGFNLLNALLKNGAIVYAIVRNPEKLLKKINDKNLIVIKGELGQITKKILSKNDNENFDIFIHFAWNGVNREEINSKSVQNKNVSDSIQCVKCAKELGCYLFIDAGSRAEYGMPKDGVMRENMKCKPVTAYGIAKFEYFNKAKRLCKKYQMTYYHLRFFSVYGIGDHPWSLISTLTTELPLGKSVDLSSCQQYWNFMHVTDATRAVILLIKNSDMHIGESKVINVASKDTRILKEFVDEIYYLCKKDGLLNYGKYEQETDKKLSVKPEIDNLIKLTNNSWDEKVSFEEGILQILQML